MNHYDGPAFFRKYRFNKPQVNNSAASQSTSVVASASPQSAASAVSKRPTSQTKDSKQVASQAARPTSDATTSSTLFNGGTHGTFHPSRVPSQLSPALTNGGIIQDHDDRNYLEIEASLHKRPETFLLFADATAADLPVVDLQRSLDASPAETSRTEQLASQQSTTVAVTSHAEHVIAAVSASATIASQAMRAVTAESDATDSSQTGMPATLPATSATSVRPTEVFEPTDPELARSAAAINTRPVDNSAVSTAPTEVFEPTDPSLAVSAAAVNAPKAVSLASVGPTEVFEPTDPSLAVSAASANATSDLTEIKSMATSTASKPAHGLGLSLGDIMTAEHDAQADLALFKDQSAAAISAASKSAAIEPRSQVDEEPYQPVGMRPVSTSPAATSTAIVSVSATATMPVSQGSGGSNATTEPAQVATSAVTTSPALSETPALESQPELVHSGGSAAPVLEDKELAAYHLPPLNLLKAPIVANESEMDDWIEQKASALDESLDAFGVNANVVDWTIGPTVTQFQVKPARGVKVSKITNLNDDLKLALAAKDIRIEAPIPGRNTIGIEIPNKKSRPVMLSEVLDSDKFRDSQSPLTVALGVDLFGQPQVTDLRKMPHGLIAGATGSGKSVFINSILVSILYKANPQQVKLLLIDPKAVELAPYNEIPHLLAPVISEPKAASAALKWVVDEMDNRYDKLAAGGARNIEQFNKLADEHGEPALKMPYIVIVIDELADLMMVASSEVQDYIARITQKARAAGIHLLVATQRPSVDVVTGLIKNNIPTRVAFMVASQIDSRTILDASGAERLLGRGDMLYLGNGQPAPLRLQGTFVDSEIDSITQFVRDQAAPHYEFQPDSLMKHEEAARNEDDLMPEALAYIADEDTMSTSKLQRNFSIGYNRAANIIDDLESRGYVSAAKGSKPRDVYFTAADLTKLQANS
ncbi:cell division protein FtsK [Lactiplantibacillus plantarum]|nr:cell division protein FtsK [Lactiplantibacillus plantarum]